MEVKEEMEGKQYQRTERLIELTEGEMEGKDLREIEHPGHDHRLLLRESLQRDDRYGQEVYCDGCREPISSSSSSSSSGVGGGGGAFYACPNSDCWFLLHKRCAELPPKIEHPSHPGHALTLSLFPQNRNCDVCDSAIDGFLYCCSDCQFDVHIRCASMALRIQDRVDENNEIHQHPLIPLEKEAQFFCDVCGREHAGKSYLCSTCGFWANQICASAPTTVDLHSHPHPLTLFRSFRYDGQICEICNMKVNRACWVYCCSEGCGDSVHVGCWLSLEAAENSNRDVEANLHSKSSRSHEIEIPTGLKEEIILITWPVPDESAELITQLIKNLSLQGTHKRDIEIPCCQRDHPLIFVNKKIDESKDDQLCNGCAQTISSQFYYCAQCKFSLHKWCAELPNELQHILHPEHPLHLRTKQEKHILYTHCHSCGMYSNGFAFGCSTCHFYLDLKCASLPRLIKHQFHDHNLVLRMAPIKHSCRACGVDEFYTSFRCEACNFKLCILCAFLPFSVRHRYDVKHPFTLTYSPIEGQPNDYYCEICEEDINSVYWFYHCIKCDQSLHPKCIHPPIRTMIAKFGAQFEVNLHSHLLCFVRRPKGGLLTPCHVCGGRFEEFNYMAFECEQCDFWLHHYCRYGTRIF